MNNPKTQMAKLIGDMTHNPDQKQINALTPEQISNKCEAIHELLYFFMMVGETVSVFREMVVNTAETAEQKQLYALISILDEAINLQVEHKVIPSIDFAELMQMAFYRESKTYKEVSNET